MGILRIFSSTGLLLLIIIMISPFAGQTENQVEWGVNRGDQFIWKVSSIGTKYFSFYLGVSISVNSIINMTILSDLPKDLQTLESLYYNTIDGSYVRFTIDETIPPNLYYDSFTGRFFLIPIQITNGTTTFKIKQLIEVYFTELVFYVQEAELGDIDYNITETSDTVELEYDFIASEESRANVTRFYTWEKATGVLLRLKEMYTTHLDEVLLMFSRENQNNQNGHDSVELSLWPGLLAFGALSIGIIYRRKINRLDQL